MSREELEEIHSKYFEGKKRIGKELPDDFVLSKLECYSYLQYTVK